MAIDDQLARMRAARIAAPPPEKKPMRRISVKKQARLDAEKKLVSSDGDTFKEQWFKARRREMTGTCQCGCAEPSQKENDTWFRGSACHIFPKEIFESVEYHALNWVERRLWAKTSGDFNACHSIMDETSMDRWPNMADWDSIKEKFFILAPLLTDEERVHKFYKHLEKLVYEI